ncbi:MAG: glycosyl transferase, family 2 [Actinomycetia bacterium]|nr:glycosyl transferase, family 2 [Actinomycetes bacterium]
MKDSLHPLTVVICTYNRAADLALTLSALRDFPCREVIVVDNGSTDDTAALLRSRPDVRWLRLAENVGVPGFAAGVGQATTPYVLLLDDDAIPRPDVAERLVRAFDADPALAAIACHIVTGDGAVVTGRWPAHPLLFWGCGAGVRTSVATSFRPMFYPRLRLHGTELDLCIRIYAADARVDYDPLAVVVHRFSATNRSTQRRLRTVTYASARFPWDHFRLQAAPLASIRALRSRAAAIRSASGAIGWLQGIADLARDVPDVIARRHVVPRWVEDAYLAGVWEYQRPGTPRIPRGVDL